MIEGQVDPLLTEAVKLKAFEKLLPCHAPSSNILPQSYRRDTLTTALPRPQQLNFPAYHLSGLKHFLGPKEGGWHQIPPTPPPRK